MNNIHLVKVITIHEDEIILLILLHIIKAFKTLY